MSALQRFIPFFNWITTYQRADLRGDITAGITVAVMLVPQGMAYAMLAGLPAVVGLYASVVPVLLYALFGTSRQLAVGPVAMVSLLTASSVGAIAQTGTAEYIALAVLLMLMVGVMQVLMGLLRAGFLVNFLSHPVVSGFTSAAALIIGLSQLKHLLGVALPRDHRVHVILWQALGKISDANWAAMVIGGSAVVILLIMKKKAPKLPGALVVVVLGTVSVAFFELNVKVVGAVQAGLPPLAMPDINMGALQALLPAAITISLVSFMESISVAKFFARKNKYDVVPNQELIGLGMANLGGAFFGGYPVTGGFSRTAVNGQAGARTPLASMITAVLIAVTLLFLTPLFEGLPKAVLAAIIMVAVFGLVDFAEVKHLWQVKRGDLGLLVLTFFATLGLGIEEGILVGVAASMMLFIIRTTRPHYAVLGRLPGTDVFRNVKNFPEAKPVDGLLAVRFDASFYFANVTFLKDRLRAEEAEMGTIQGVILDMSGVNALDSSAASALLEIAEDYMERGISLHFSSVKGPVRAVMKRAHLWDKVGEGRMAFTTAQAVADFLGEAFHVTPTPFNTANVPANAS